MQDKLKQLISMDDYIRETVGPALTLETMLWQLKNPMFDLCETEGECSAQHQVAKESKGLKVKHERRSLSSKSVSQSLS